MPTQTDAAMMALAVRLAARGEGAVEPNPMVGCVLAHGDQVVGKGWHQQFGGPHAEVNALAAAGERAAGATAYVTLEPCCHTGKTPPCTGALIAAGVARVVFAVRDPFPQVNGGGLQQLTEAGIECHTGVGEEDARRLLAPYLKLTQAGRPWVIAKWAMTLDGKLATSTGSSQWISSPESREIVHQLRGRVDAIIVGAGTARDDDPLLTARPAGPRTAARVVLGEVAPGSQLARTIDQAPVISVVPSQVARHRAADGVEVLALGGRNHTERLASLLDELGARRMTNVLIEGGARGLGAAFDGGLIDEVHAFVAPKLCGGADAPSPIGGHGLADMTKALALSDVAFDTPGGDVYVRGRVARA
ncbi:Riboflavin biosynthesis protein RibD [Posidoniimonas polymericola]|uniref:Riboflavin biosynthesis protein RibD n=1 Tax=Posidoniimonas polymericola TaxID=2528002 RepID=A0A5C5ZD98_9BACT|nr:bifunctional diaminohydroxyphosphoribosylaminopyrimidine deaminase/5-amino-6-(5-phosphoribosylamino)uracil reductase RibD [Posidoniimonas polymericola]TWT85314.1 Riboflavin biosynthesis protein RibD [Posidoniimonas polymericola]